MMNLYKNRKMLHTQPASALSAVLTSSGNISCTAETNATINITVGIKITQPPAVLSNNISSISNGACFRANK